MSEGPHQELYHQQWLSRIAKGDEAVFSELYHSTSGNIYSAVITYVKAVYIAEEIVQEVYIRLWNNRDKLTGIQSLENYLFILARNIAMDHFRKVTAEQKLLAALREAVPLHRETTSEQLMEKEYRAIQERAVIQLPAQQQQVYRLAQEQELPLADIATQMQLSRSTVKKHLELARRFVREYVNSQVHYYITIPVFALANFFCSH